MQTQLTNLETLLANINARLDQLQIILEDDNTSDADWDAAKAEVIKLDGERMDVRSQISSVKCEMRVAAKIS